MFRDVPFVAVYLAVLVLLTTARMEPARLRQQFDSGSRNPRGLIHDDKPTGRSGLSQRKTSWRGLLKF
jgi:hypothetical protein